MKFVSPFANSGSRQTSLRRHMLNLRGSTGPFLALASDGVPYVVKYAASNRNGLLFSEAMGTELFRGFGLTVPNWKPLFVSDSFINSNQQTWPEYDGVRERPQAGLAFGSRFLLSETNAIFEILPGTSHQRIQNRDEFWLAWLVDVCASHHSHRKAIFCQSASRQFVSHFIDHSHTFGGPRGELLAAPRACSYLDTRVYDPAWCPPLDVIRTKASSFDAESVWRNSQLLPLEWRCRAMESALGDCLSKLTSDSHIVRTLEVLVNQSSSVRQEAIASPATKYVPGFKRLLSHP